MKQKKIKTNDYDQESFRINFIRNMIYILSSIAVRQKSDCIVKN